MGTLAEELSQLTNPAPVFHDPEDSDDFYTSAKVEKNIGYDDDYAVHTSEPSQLRQKAIVSLGDIDKKYAGKKTSRQKLDDADDIEISDENISGDSEESSDEYNGDSSEDMGPEDTDENISDSEAEGGTEEDAEIESFQNKLSLATKGEQNSFSFVDDGDYSKYADDGDDMNENDDEDYDNNSDDVDDDDSEDEEMDNEGDDIQDFGGEDGISSFSKTSADEEVQKGQAAKYQLELWDGLLEGRIKLQKVVTAVNQLPQSDTWETFEKSGGEKFQENAASAQQMLKTLLDKLIQLQTVLMLQNKETEHVITGSKSDTLNSKTPKSNDDDEEITSESEDEVQNEVINQPKIKAGMKRIKKISDYPEFLAKRHKDFQTFRNNTIQKWNDKTRLAGGKINSKSFSAFELSALKQIEQMLYEDEMKAPIQILSDKERLIKRTQMKRSVYKVLGKSEEEESRSDGQPSDTVEESTRINDKQQNYDAEIFDDSDFYHQQLRVLIERKTSDISDPVALSKQWLEIQKMRNKVKKKVDTRASKGRKTRYNVHSKLVNFMAPLDNCSWTDDARNDLFSSLFGKRFQVSDDR